VLFVLFVLWFLPSTTFTLTTLLVINESFFHWSVVFMIMLLLRIIKILKRSQDIKPLPILNDWIALVIVFLLYIFNFFFFTVVCWLQLFVLPML
jgi:hypothetical protein